MKIGGADHNKGYREPVQKPADDSEGYVELGVEEGGSKSRL